jgi:Chalcone isomerase-like
VKKNLSQFRQIAHLSNNRRMLLIAAGLVPVTGAIGFPKPAGLPAELDEFSAQNSWRRRGTATLRVLLFRVYDATLWSSSEKSNPLEEAAPFALDITYAMSVKRDDIIDTSIQEITRLRNPSAATLSKWSNAMKSVIPSVATGDRLLGLSVPGKSARFYLNGKLIGEVNDPVFSEAFFAIWLDNNTKKPDMRRALLAN